MKIKLKDIVIDEAIYPRSKVNEYNIQRMMQAYDAGARFPSVTVEAGTRRLIDGRHRYETFSRKGAETISATEKVYASEADLFADAVRLNIDHGVPLDQFSIRTSVARLQEYGVSREAISEIVRIPVEGLESITKGFATSTAGEPIALKGGLSHMRGEQLTDRQMEVNRSYAGGKAAFYARQIADLLETDLWPRRSPAFVEQMNRLTRLWDSAKTDVAIERRA